MSAKSILIVCAQALLAQCVFSQCTSRAAVDASGIAGPFGWAGSGLAAPAFGPALAYDGLAAPVGCNGFANGLYPAVASALEFTPTTGGGLVVTSSSIVPPTGISVVSDNAYEGILEVVGELPFVGTTAMDGMVPSYGAGAINHGCGAGINIMTALSGVSSPATVATTSGFGNGAYAAPGLAASALAAPAIAGPILGAPALAYDGIASYGTGFGYDVACGSPIDGIEITPTSGGSLPVASSSPVPPSGIVVNSETAYEGPLAVTGDLPFVGTVAMEGVLPTGGAGAINHACGNGINAMVSEITAFAPGYAPNIYGSAAGISPGIGCGNRWAGRGYGYAF